MEAMFGQGPRVHKDIMDLDLDKLMEVLLEHLMHETLECEVGVDQAICHDKILIVACRGHKGRLMYPDEVVSALKVQIHED